MTYLDFPILSFAIWCPILFGILVLLLGKSPKNDFARYLSFLGSLLALGITLFLPVRFNSHYHGIQFEENIRWIERFNINYHLGVDGLSLWFVVLTALMTFIVVLSAWRSEKENFPQYISALLILSGLMTGAFCALDGALFYVFFEATLIPMFLIIGVWGGERRIYAAFKFFIYTFLGSVFMLIVILYLYFKTGTFNIFSWYTLPLPLMAQIFLFIGFIFAFAVKVPMWPVHTWLPDAHVEAPTEGSVVLAAIMLKLGAYGFIRFILPVVPDACRELAWIMIILSLIAIIYIALIALVQQDLKKLIAYSSVAHMGFVTLGFFVFQEMAVGGSIIQMISHGLISAGFFLCIGMLYDRTQTRRIEDFGGVVNTMPRFATLFVIFALANAGMPGTSGFIGEFMVIIGSVKSGFWIGFGAASALVLGAAYSLWMVKRVIFGPVKNKQVARLADVSNREFFILGILAIIILVVGFYPALITDFMQNSVNDLMQQISRSKIP